MRLGLDVSFEDIYLARFQISKPNDLKLSEVFIYDLYDLQNTNYLHDLYDLHVCCMQLFDHPSFVDGFFYMFDY